MRRKKSAIPVVRSHRGLARLRLNGREFWLGRFGSPEAITKADRLIASWLANGRRLPDDSPPVVPEHLPCPQSPQTDVRAAVDADAKPLPPLLSFTAPAEPDGTGLTVGEVCELWLAWIKAERVVGKVTCPHEWNQCLSPG